MRLFVEFILGMSVLQYKFFHIIENILYLSKNFELKFFCLFLICSQLFYTFCRRSFWHCDLFFKGNISPFRKSTTYFLQILTFRIKWVEHLIVSLTSYGKYSENFRNCKFGTPVPSTSVLKKASLWYEIRLLWAKINHVKSHAMTLAFKIQIDINQIFQMRCCTPL